MSACSWTFTDKWSEIQVCDQHFSYLRDQPLERLVLHVVKLHFLSRAHLELWCWDHALSAIMAFAGVHYQNSSEGVTEFLPETKPRRLSLECWWKPVNFLDCSCPRLPGIGGDGAEVREDLDPFGRLVMKQRKNIEEHETFRDFVDTKIILLSNSKAYAGHGRFYLILPGCKLYENQSIPNGRDNFYDYATPCTK
ncbi:hypothetical protein EI94DRAFT_618077 [Lactarius quietus]|nr:hypothetical protein EI94DRAFT_618077 [Lactarius quietus]